MFVLDWGFFFDEFYVLAGFGEEGVHFVLDCCNQFDRGRHGCWRLVAFDGLFPGGFLLG